MNKEQLFNAIDRIDDKYVSETEHYDPETMKIRAFPYIYFVPLALAAASVAAVLIAGHSIRPGNIPGTPEIDNNVLTESTSYTDESCDTSLYSETAYGTETEVNTEAEITENGTASETAGKLTDITLTGGVTEKPVTQNGAQTPATVKPSDTASTSGRITDPVPTRKPVSDTTVPQTLPVTAGRPENTTPYKQPDITEAQTTRETRPATSQASADLPSPHPSGSPAWPVSPSPSAYPSASPAAPVSASPTPYLSPTASASPAAPPTNAVRPDDPSPSGDNPENNIFSDYSEFAEAVRNYDPNDGNYFDAAFERFKTDGYFYAVEEPEYVGNIILIPGSRTEDIGLLSSVYYGGYYYTTIVYSADKDLISETGREVKYFRERFNTNPYKLNSDDVWYDSRGAYFFIDDEHYCFIQSSASDYEMKDFVENLEFEKVFY